MDDLDSLALLTLRVVQVSMTAYAIWAVWRAGGVLHHGAGNMLLPLLAILLVLSLISAGRSPVDGDLLWWAYMIYDLALPLAVIKLTGAGWCWPFCRWQGQDRARTRA